MAGPNKVFRSRRDAAANRRPPPRGSRHFALQVTCYIFRRFPAGEPRMQRNVWEWTTRSGL